MHSPKLSRPFYGSALFLFAILSSANAQTLDFSLTTASPKVPGSFSASDIIESAGVDIRIPSGELGAGVSAADIAGISYGQAEAADLNTSNYFYKRIAWSVDNNSLGSGPPIAPEAGTDGAAGDTFALDFVRSGTTTLVLRRPYTLRKAQTRNLTVKTGPTDAEDDIDGLSLFRASKYPVYLTFSPGAGFETSSIYIIRLDGNTPVIEEFATATDLGIGTSDVIDAFSLGTVPFGGAPPLTLAQNTVIWISLAQGSPSRGASDSVNQAWPAPRHTILSATDMNLSTSDEINAFAVLDPGGSDTPIPITTITNEDLVGTSVDLGTVLRNVSNLVPSVTDGKKLFTRSGETNGGTFSESKLDILSLDSSCTLTHEASFTQSGNASILAWRSAADPYGGSLINQVYSTTFEPGAGGPTLAGSGTWHINYNISPNTFDWAQKLGETDMNVVGFEYLKNPREGGTDYYFYAVDGNAFNLGSMSFSNHGGFNPNAFIGIASAEADGVEGVAGWELSGVFADDDQEFLGVQFATAHITQDPEGHEVIDVLMGLETFGGDMKLRAIYNDGSESTSTHPISQSSPTSPEVSAFILRGQFRVNPNLSFQVKHIFTSQTDDLFQPAYFTAGDINDSHWSVAAQWNGSLNYFGGIFGEAIGRNAGVFAHDLTSNDLSGCIAYNSPTGIPDIPVVKLISHDRVSFGLNIPDFSNSGPYSAPLTNVKNDEQAGAYHSTALGVDSLVNVWNCETGHLELNWRFYPQTPSGNSTIDTVRVSGLIADDNLLIVMGDANTTFQNDPYNSVITPFPSLGNSQLAERWWTFGRKQLPAVAPVMNRTGTGSFSIQTHYPHTIWESEDPRGQWSDTGATYKLYDFNDLGTSHFFSASPSSN